METTMFTLPKDFIHIKRGRSNKKRPSTFITSQGQRLPLMPFKPSYLDVKHFAIHRDCSRLMLEHPWLVNVRLFENPLLSEQLVKADYETLTIQLSSEVLQQDLSLQRDIFIRVICSFLAQKLFGDIDNGEPYQLLVKRYSAKTLPIVNVTKLRK